MIENNEVKITTREGMDVLRIVNKLGLKEDISNAIETYITLNNRKEKRVFVSLIMGKSFL